MLDIHNTITLNRSMELFVPGIMTDPNIERLYISTAENNGVWEA